VSFETTSRPVARRLPRLAGHAVAGRQPADNASVARIVFDADLSKSVGDAFDAVWSEVVKDTRYSSTELDFARFYLAERMLNLAQKGERETARLRDQGLKLFRLPELT
jgi:hypothetical protein